MIFYDCNGNERHFDELTKFSSEGWCSEVYQYDSNMMLKKYRDSCFRRLRLNKDVCDIIQRIDSPHIYKINDLLFSKNEKKSPVAAYTYQYVKSDHVDILTMPTEYMIYNMNELSKLFTKFSDYHIRVGDLKTENTVLQKDNIVLIDLDLFRKVLMSKGRVNKRNQLDLLYLFKDLLSDCAYIYDYSDDFLDSIIEIFANCSKSADGVLEVQKQFQKHKYPVDYINKYTKNKI